MTHAVEFRSADRRNSSADADTWTAYPSDLTKFAVAARINASSSIMEITESLDKLLILHGDTGTPWHLCPVGQSAPRNRHEKLYLGLHALCLITANSKNLSHPHQIDQ